MKIKGRLYFSVAAIAFAGCLAGAPVPLSAQQTPPAAVAIDNDDIGGVVTGPNGPEAGVWVIAETHDLPDPLYQDRRHRRSGPLRGARSAEGELQRLGARLRPRRFAEGRRASPARPSIIARCRRRTQADAAKYYPAIYWYSMLKIPTADQFGGKDKRHSRQASRSRSGSTP